MMIAETKLKALVLQYQIRFIHNDIAWLNHLSSFEDLELVIRRASLALGPEGKRHPHQRRISRDVLIAVADRLVEREGEISRVKDFDDLYQIIESSRVKGFGPLAIYDTAHRIGWKLKVYPKKVYMHTGTGEGARLLGLDRTQKALEIASFPEPLRVLEPYQIEDFLCIFKKNLQRSRTYPSTPAFLS